MATQTVTLFIDDLDGTEAHQTVAFALDGVEYEIDLSNSNADQLRAALEGFVSKARRVGGRKVRGARVASNGGGANASADRAENRAIREWARGQGKEVAARGRIPQELIEEYRLSVGAPNTDAPAATTLAVVEEREPAGEVAEQPAVPAVKAAGRRRPEGQGEEAGSISATKASSSRRRRIGAAK
jgi:hypothetical protein